MPLFFTQHCHSPAGCPASGARGLELLSRISAPNDARHGVTIEAEALIDGEHRLMLVVEAPDGQAVQRFLAFLADCGDLQIMAASATEEAVERGGCDPVRQPLGGDGWG